MSILVAELEEEVDELKAEIKDLKRQLKVLGGTAYSCPFDCGFETHITREIEHHMDDGCSAVPEDF